MSETKDAVYFEDEDYDINQELYNVYAARSANKSEDEVEKELLINTTEKCLSLSGMIMKAGTNKDTYKDELLKAIAQTQNCLLELQYHFIDDVDTIDGYMWEDAEKSKNDILNPAD